MRILILGASGLLGRATLPRLRGHLLVGTTRKAANCEGLAALGARPEVCDIYDAGALARIATAFAPEIVVNFLTDLAGGPGPGNSRIRSEGGPLVSAAARACGARRLVVESIAFETPAPSAAAVAALEADATQSGLEPVILRFGRFWGPGTWSAVALAAPTVHIDVAGRRAATLILGATPGTHVVQDGDDKDDPV